MDRYERILTLHRLLKGARYPVPLPRLLEELGCSRATLYRDLAFLRAGRMPMARGHMLRVLSGTQHGWWRRHRLEDGFIAALDGALHASRMP